MGHVVADRLVLAGPHGTPLVGDVSFRISDGERYALCGGPAEAVDALVDVLAGWSTPLAGQLTLGGTVAVAVASPRLVTDGSVRRFLTTVAPASLQHVGRRLAAAEERLAAGDRDAGMDVAEAVAAWSAAGGYELEDAWRQAVLDVLGRPWEAVCDLPAEEIPPQQRHHLGLLAALQSGARIVMLDRPEDLRAIVPLPELVPLVTSTRATLGLVTDSEALLRVADTFITLEPGGCWVFRGTYDDYVPRARDRRKRLETQERQWRDEERRLYAHYRKMKERAAINSKNASKARAAETRWKRFVRDAPPGAPEDSRR